MPLIFILLNCSIGDNDISAAYEDGIFRCDSFLYWNNIKGYRYSKQNFDNKEYNFLEIKVREKAFGSKSISGIHLPSFHLRTDAELTPTAFAKAWSLTALSFCH